MLTAEENRNLVTRNGRKKTQKKDEKKEPNTPNNVRMRVQEGITKERETRTRARGKMETQRGHFPVRRSERQQKKKRGGNSFTPVCKVKNNCCCIRATLVQQPWSWLNAVPYIAAPHCSTAIFSDLISFIIRAVSQLLCPLFLWCAAAAAFAVAGLVRFF